MQVGMRDMHPLNGEQKATSSTPLQQKTMQSARGAGRVLQRSGMTVARLYANKSVKKTRFVCTTVRVIRTMDQAKGGSWCNTHTTQTPFIHCN